MPYPYDAADLAAINRCATLYNGNPYNATTNPGGMANDGHRVNFVPSLQDVAIIASAVSSAASSASASASASAQSAASLSATSTTPVTLSPGSKNFTTQAGKSFASGTVYISSDANPTTHWMIMQVTSYVGTTLQGTVLQFSGSGSRSDWTIRVTGYASRAAGLSYAWSTNQVASDPTSGRVKTNAAGTALYISETDLDGNLISALLATWINSTSIIKGRIRLQQTTQPTNFAEYNINSYTDNGTWNTFGVTPVASGGAFAADAILQVLFTQTGDKGDTGITGTTGDTGATGNAGFEFIFNTVLSGDPGPGEFRFNAAFASATAFAISETDNNGNSIASYLTAIDNSTSTRKVMVVATKQDSSAYFSFWIDAELTDLGVYDQFSITPIQTSGTIVTNDVFYVVFVPVGQKGDTGSTGLTGEQGAPASLTYTFSAVTSPAASDPGNNVFRFTSATISAVNKVYIDLLGPGGVDVTAWIESWDDSNNTVHKGSLIFIQQSDATKYAIFTTGDIVTQTGFREVPLTYVAGPGGFTDASTVVVSFVRTGNKGADGAGSGTIQHEGASTPTNDLVLWGADNQHVKAGGVKGNLANLNTVGATQIDANAVTNAKLAQMAQGTVKTRRSGVGTGDPTDTTLVDFKTDLAITKADVGLANVDNTSDANKPISTAQAAVNLIKRIASVRIIAQANGVLSTAFANGQTVDGVSLVTGDVICLNGQTSAAENGIRVVAASGVPPRHSDFDTFNEYPGAFLSVQEGTVGADTTWLCTSNRGGTLDTSPIVFDPRGQPASTTLAGVVELATPQEAGLGTDAIRAVTPAALFPDWADVGSATTTNIGAATTDKVRITGTATIVAFDNVNAGILRYIRFMGVLILTHNVASLILPGAANITTAANDRATAISLGGGNWIITNYTRADGKAVIAPSASEITTGTLPTAQLPANIAKLDTADQAVTGGARVTVLDLGTAAGTVTPDPGDRPMQRLTNNAAFTLAPGVNRGSYLLSILNGATPGTITTSGWGKVAGDAFTTTTGHRFLCSCIIDEDGSVLIVQTRQ